MNFLKTSTMTNSYAIIAGYASTFNNLDKSQHIILSTAFSDHTLMQKIPILFQHKKQHLLGEVLYSEIDKYGLYIEGALLLENRLQQQVYESITKSKIRGLSIGMRIASAKREGSTLFIENGDLEEISLTSQPVNSQCKIDFYMKYN